MYAYEELILPILALGYFAFGGAVVVFGRAFARRLQTEQRAVWREIGEPEVTWRSGLSSIRLHRKLFLLNLPAKALSPQLTRIRMFGRTALILFYIVIIFIIGYALSLLVASFGVFR